MRTFWFCCCKLGSSAHQTVRRSLFWCAGMVATQMTQGMGGEEERKIQPTVSS